MVDYSTFSLGDLRIECKKKGVKFSKEDTVETLRKKLSPKPAKKPTK